MVLLVGGRHILLVAGVEAPTVRLPVVPSIDALAASVAVRVSLPAVFSVALKVPTPLVRVEFDGREPAPSVLVKCTVPV